ncbi:MAG: hypothetical protein ACJ8E4_08660 [Sphingomicrobium sp.]
MSLLARIGLAILVLLLVEAAGLPILPIFLMIIQRWLAIWPAPTEHFAGLAGDIAWPLVVVYFLTRYSAHLKGFLDTVSERLKRDRVKMGPFELVPNTEVIALDRQAVNQSTETYLPDDIERVERLFEFITEPDNFSRLLEWMAKNVDPDVEVGSFLTEPPYANQREAAYAALIDGIKGQR